MLLGVDHPSFSSLRAEAEVCRSAGWYWPNQNWIMISERPQAIRRDNEGRLHCENGPAIDYGETFKLYVWRGTTIPAAWIENPKQLTPQIALSWRNLEQRRAAIEMIGWNRILTEMQATVIDDDRDPQIGTLLEVRLPDLSRPARFLRVQCGTGRTFAVGVPPDVQTALAAQAWMQGRELRDFQKPEVRT